MQNMGVSVAGRGVAWSVEIGEWRLVLCVVRCVFCVLFVVYRNKNKKGNYRYTQVALCVFHFTAGSIVWQCEF